MRDAHWVCAAMHKVPRQHECPLRSAMKAERTGIGENCGVQASRHLRRYIHPGLTSEGENHLCGRAGAGIDPVYVRKPPRCRVVIDVDEVVPVEAGEARTLHAVTFQNDGGFRVGSLFSSAQHRFAEWEWPVNTRHTVAQDDIRLFSHAA